MSKSLADQLLGAGLVDPKKAKKARQQQRKQSKQQKHSKTDVPDETKQRLAQQREAQAERDRQLNQQRVEAERQKAMRAQVRQMLEHSGIRADGDVRFNFTDPVSKKIKHTYVNRKQQDQLAAGMLAICADGDKFVIVPGNIADKIAERFADAVVFRVDKREDTDDEDDPYKDHPIPDDLMW
jgi:uncharacterized protein